MSWEEVFEICPVPMSLVDSFGRQVAANSAHARFLGYDRTEIADLDAGRVSRPEDQAWTRRYLMRLVTGEIDRFESDKYYVHKDGTHVLGHLTAHAIRTASGECTHVLASVTPLDAAAPVGQPSPGVADRLLEFGWEMVSLVGADGQVRLTRGMHAPTHGYPTTYWRERHIAELFAPGEWERLVDVRHEVAATPGAQVEVDVEVQTGDGEIRTIAARVYNCLDDPVLEGFVIVSRDVTEERAVLSELRRRRRTAEAVVDAQTRLLATVSHELRNPLHAVRGIAELLAAEQLEPRAAELARSLVRQLAGLTHVTQDLLDAARLDAGKVDIASVPTDLASLVDDVVELGRAAARSKSVAVDGRVARDVPTWVLVDADRLRQVLGNLVGNAVKFTERGSVQLVVRSAPSGRVSFSVVDTGVGIPIEEQRAILQPFTVASTAGGNRGAGLGLAIVQRLVAAMGGRVELTSVLGQGSRFEVSLPLEPCGAPPEAARDELPTGLRVLVVEDNVVNQQLAKTQLERLELVPTIVGTGEDGLAALIAAGPGGFDVVLMDHQLPGWSGTETTRRIRALDGALAEVPVIGVSASAARSDQAEFLAAGMDDFVAKPATLDDLARAIGSVMAGRALAGGVAAAGATSGAPGPAAAGEAAIDDGVLVQLASDLGGDEIVRDLIGTFLGELDARVQAILDGEDETTRRRAAHTLKSSARLLGANALADCCAEIERVDRGSDIVADLALLTRAALEERLYDAGG